MTISLHESGQYLFPGTGQVHELGSGVGRGLKLNVPLEPFTEGESYLEVLERCRPARAPRSSGRASSSSRRAPTRTSTTSSPT